MTGFTIEGARVLLPEDSVETSVTVEDGKIVGIGEPSGLARVDGRGLTLAPALIDVHGDAHERQVMPRPGVFFPLETAILETDRQLAANGIATAYQSITLGWEPGLRAIERGRDYIRSLNALSRRLLIENRVQLRWETFAFEAIELLEEALNGPYLPSIAFNDHTSMGMRSFDTRIQERLFEHNPDFAQASFDDPRMRGRHERNAQRSGIDYDSYMALLEGVVARRPEVPAKIAEVARMGKAKGAAMLSHDDTQVETRAFYRDLGVTVSEFPMTLAPTKDARANGDAIIFGSPNVLRGGSHIGSLGAADMVEEGLCDVLASDYYYPAMLAAVARLDTEKRGKRPALWQLVSTGPARAMGLADRGEIAVGQRADLVLLDWPDQGAPAVRATYCAGRLAYRGVPLA